MQRSPEYLSGDVSPVQPVNSVESANFADEERGFAGHSAAQHHSTQTPDETSGETNTFLTPTTLPANGFIRKHMWKLLCATAPFSPRKQSIEGAAIPKLEALAQAYLESDVATKIRSEMIEISNAQRHGINNTNELPDVVVESSLLRSRKQASWGTQFRILSGRAFKNLYRDPALLAAHYLSSVALACKSFSRSSL